MNLPLSFNVKENINVIANVNINMNMNMNKCQMNMNLYHKDKYEYGTSYVAWYTLKFILNIMNQIHLISLLLAFLNKSNYKKTKYEGGSNMYQNSCTAAEWMNGA